MLGAGELLPEFTAVDHERRTVTSDDLHAAWTVLWWYSKADTAG